MTISIVIPCFNCEATLDKAVQSFIGQYGEIYEIVLVDDGSMDETAKLCDGYSKKYEFIKVIHKENGGLVSAWKAGVMAADGDYVVFCDADDYIDRNLISRLVPVISDHYPDMIVYGIQTEFDNGDKDVDRINLSEGYYGKGDIQKNILPNLLSDGRMQSELLLSSRCNKAFKRELLERTMGDVPEDISLGEDDVTCFSYVLNCDSLYVISDYYPYHYIRHNSSMIGVYDANAFAKIERLYDKLEEIAEKYEYTYPEQLRLGYVSIMVLFMKKEICRNPYGYTEVKNNINKAKNSRRFMQNGNYYSVRKYSFLSKVFAVLILSDLYLPAYILTRFFDKNRGRGV